jgi:hypothetical protein
MRDPSATLAGPLPYSVEAPSRRAGVRTGARRWAWPALALVATVAAVVPLWSSALLPFQDGPEHLAAIRVLADFHTPGFGFEHWFQIDLARLQYLAFYLPAAGLSKWMGPQAACRVMLSLIALALPVSVWMLLGAFGRDRRLAVLAPAVLHSQTTYLGFFNFVESIPAAILTVALVERELHAPKWTRSLALAVVSSLLLWLHPSALAFALGTAGVLALTSGEPWRKVVRGLASLVPALGLFGVWAVQALAHRDGGGVAHSAPQWLGIKLQVLELLRFGNVLAGHTDELFWAALVGHWLLAKWAPGRPNDARGWRLPLLAVLCLLGYLVLPYQVGFMGYIHLRALPFLILLAIALPRLAPGRRSSALARFGPARSRCPRPRARDRTAPGGSPSRAGAPGAGSPPGSARASRGCRRSSPAPGRRARPRSTARSGCSS